MKMKRHAVAGNFVGRPLGPGAWQLTTGATGGPEIYVVGAEPNSAITLRGTTFTAVSCEWHSSGAVLTLTSSAGVKYLKARNATIHEPLIGLYERLPLVGFDDAARRFWRRLFRFVRVPGGRHLLGFIARRVRGPR
jgi:hypothetical protein